MNIEVKGINDVLVMKCFPDVSFAVILDDLNKLLDQPIFQQDGYFPRAFFDFECRQISDNDLKRLIMLLYEKKKVLFGGIAMTQHYQSIEMYSEQVHNGDELYVNNETLFLGVVNTGGVIYCNKDVYFLNEVKGTIVALNGDVKIYGHQFTHAQIVINHKSIHDLTTSAFVSVYYNDNNIIFKEEDGYDKNHSFDFR